VREDEINVKEKLKKEEKEKKKSLG